MSVNPVLATEAKDLDPKELFESRIEFLRSNRSFFLCFVFVAQQQQTWWNQNEIIQNFDVKLFKTLTKNFQHNYSNPKYWPLIVKPGLWLATSNKEILVALCISYLPIMYAQGCTAHFILF